MSVASIGNRLGAKAAAIQMPIGAESSFRGIIDLSNNEAAHVSQTTMVQIFK